MHAATWRRRAAWMAGLLVGLLSLGALARYLLLPRPLRLVARLASFSEWAYDHTIPCDAGILLCSDDGHARLLDWRDGREVWRAGPPFVGVVTHEAYTCISPQGRYLVQIVCGRVSSRVSMWDRGRWLGTATCPFAYYDCRLLETGDCWVSETVGRRARVHLLRHGKRCASSAFVPFEDRAHGASGPTITADGRIMGVSSDPRGSTLYDLAVHGTRVTLTPRGRLPAHGFLLEHGSLLTAEGTLYALSAAPRQLYTGDLRDRHARTVSARDMTRQIYRVIDVPSGGGWTLPMRRHSVLDAVSEDGRYAVLRTAPHTRDVLPSALDRLGRLGHWLRCRPGGLAVYERPGRLRATLPFARGKDGASTAMIGHTRYLSPEVRAIHAAPPHARLLLITHTAGGGNEALLLGW